MDNSYVLSILIVHFLTDSTNPAAKLHFCFCQQPSTRKSLPSPQQLLIGRRGGVVELVHNDVIVKIRRGFARKILRIERLNGEKQMVDAFRLIAADEQLAEVRVLEHRAESIQALLQNFLAVRDEQQPTRRPI